MIEAGAGGAGVGASASTSASAVGDADAVRIVGVGAGPAGIMMLERMLANHARDYPGLKLDIRLVDPYEPGGGRIWRRTQSPLLKLNTMLRDDSVFTDASCEIDGPISPGPSLSDWIAEVRAGRIARPDWWDDLLERELREVTHESFPTRRLNSAYLGWAYREIIARAAPGVSVQWVQDRVIAVEEPLNRPGDQSTPYFVRLESGASLEADLVLHTIGHNGSEPSPKSQELADFAERQGLSYVPPAFTADADFDWVMPGVDVIVRGMGLAAVDLVVLLTEGRGGKFVPDGEKLRYLPSGREPVLHIGSRRGVPYRSKVTTQQLGDTTRLEYLGVAFHESVAASQMSLDFDADVWPLVAAELLTGYYRELFTGHPELVRGEWGVFAREQRSHPYRPAR
ncbi:FAD/NAD(P)-binding protein [Dietzia sp. B19]|uniref:FAD/NAD(P)-binding protein n=1 Tax=Dietzia sp. B19 TaxID=1630632 RepID=UPI003220670E